MKKRRNSTKIESQLKVLKNKWVIYTHEQTFLNKANPYWISYILYSKPFASYSKQVWKINNRKRSVTTIKRSDSTPWIQDNSENIHPNVLNANNYLNISHDVGRNKALNVSNSYWKESNSTIQVADQSWYANQRPMSSIGVNHNCIPLCRDSNKKLVETRSTINSSNHPNNVHTSIHSISEDDQKSFFYRPMSYAPIGMPNYIPWNNNEVPLHKRYCNSLSTIVKDENTNREDFYTNKSISNF